MAHGWSFGVMDGCRGTKGNRLGPGTALGVCREVLRNKSSRWRRVELRSAVTCCAKRGASCWHAL